MPLIFVPAWGDLVFNVGAADPEDIAAYLGDETAAFESGPIFQAIEGRIGSHAPSVAAFADGELLAAWYSYAGPHELDGSAIYMSRRAAEGGEWEPPRLHIDRPQGDGNPVLYVEGEEVWLFQAVVPGGWSTAHVAYQRSSDRGATWSPPRVLSAALGTNARYPPVRLGDGSLLFPAYDDLIPRALFFKSCTLLPDAWTPHSVVSTLRPFDCIQPSVAALSDGRLLAVMRNNGGGWLWVTSSSDGGRTWLSPRDSGFPNPNSPAALFRTARGGLVLVFNDSNESRRPLSASLSPDDGATWTPARVLVGGEGAYSYPSVTEGPDGMIHIVYSHDRTHIEHIAVNEAWIAGG